MKKSKKDLVVFVFLLLGALFILTGCGNDNINNNANQNDGGYNATKTTTDTNTLEPKVEEKPVQETELYSYSTEIKSTKKARENNISITCDRINNSIIKKNEEFSFCDIVGKPIAEDGYEKADAFDSEGNIIQVIGGGNCQVSSTIYNAALGVEGIEITERHEHSRDVSYVPDGKDATIAYDYLDLKFENNTDYDIKIYAECSNKEVTVRIMKLS